MIAPNSDIATLQSLLRRNSNDLNALDAHNQQLLNQRAELCYNLSLARGYASPPVPSIATTRPSKTQTCSLWAIHPSRCPKDSTTCAYAHHYFPTMTFRAHFGGEKLEECKHFPRCAWGDEVCGFAHGKGGKQEREKMKEYAKRLPYRVVMVVQCKACGTPLESVEEAEAHAERGECYAVISMIGQGRMGGPAEDQEEEIGEGDMSVKRRDVVGDEDLQMQDMGDGEIEG